MKKKKILFYGLGKMGYPMAGHLAKKAPKIQSVKILVYNRTLEKSFKWGKEFKGSFLNSAELTKNAPELDFIFSCLGRDEDVKEVFLSSKGSKGLSSLLKPGCVVVDHSTISYKMSCQLAKNLADKKIGFLDAPISGGEIGAQRGQLSIMLGGDKKNFNKVLPFLKTYGKKIILIGKGGSGQLTKMVNQICIAGLLQGLSEGVNFATQAKLNFDKVLKAISGGAAQSWQMDNRAKTMQANQFNFGFQIKWMIKDLEYALFEGKKNGTRLTITKNVLARYRKLLTQGHGSKDTSALKLYNS